MPSVQKVCVGCNTDVANKKRVKDTQGNYYCQSCYEAKLAGKKSAVRTPEPETVPTAVADPYDFPPEPAAEPMDLGDIGLAEEPQELAPQPMAADMFGCADCKKLVNSKQIRNDDGDFVCTACFAKRRIRGARSAPAASRQSAAAADAEPGKPSFGDSIVGGLAFTAASIAAVFAFVFAFQFVLPLPNVAVEMGNTLKDPSTAFGVGLLYSFYHVGFSFIIGLSAFIAIKATRNPTSFGALLWKTFALCGGVTIFFRITDQWFLGHVFGIIPAVFFGIRYSAVATGLSNLFQLDSIPRRIAAFFGMILTELFGFAFYIFFGALIGLQVIHHEHVNLNDEPDMKQFQQEFQKALDKSKQQHDGNQAAPADDNAAPADKDAQPAAPAADKDAAPPAPPAN